MEGVSCRKHGIVPSPTWLDSTCIAYLVTIFFLTIDLDPLGRCDAMHHAKMLFSMPKRASLPFYPNTDLSLIEVIQSSRPAIQSYPLLNRHKQRLHLFQNPRVLSTKSQSSNLRVSPKIIPYISVFPLVRHPFIVFLPLCTRPHLVSKIFDRAGSVILLFIAQLRH